ncbi:hypothetical protein KUO10_23470, partial [Vibrio vulnificus]|nr:hypothetical protein [Vibrio vulnificus]
MREGQFYQATVNIHCQGAIEEEPLSHNYTLHKHFSHDPGMPLRWRRPVRLALSQAHQGIDPLTPAPAT